MALSLKTGQYLYEPQEFEDPRHPLEAEFGWQEVARGLAYILFGYFLLAAAWALGALAIAIAVAAPGSDFHVQLPKQAPGMILFMTMGFLGLATLLIYGLVIYGKWRCVMNAPERHGAKWMMFACILCMLVSPALGFVFSLSGEGAENYKYLKQGNQGWLDVKFTTTGGAMQLVSTGAGLASTVFFVFFLRSVARCFNSDFCVGLIYVYLIYFCLLVGFTAQIAFHLERLLGRPDLVLGLIGGWVLAALWYVTVVFSVRATILRGLNRGLVPASAEEEGLA